MAPHLQAGSQSREEAEGRQQGEGHLERWNVLVHCPRVPAGTELFWQCPNLEWLPEPAQRMDGVAEAVKGKFSPQNKDFLAQGSLFARLSPALPLCASTAQKDVGNLHLPPWLQHWLPKPCHLCKCSPAPGPGPWGWEQQLPVGQTQNLGTAGTFPLAPAATRAVAQLRSTQRGTALPSQLLCPPTAASQASPLSCPCCWGDSGLCLPHAGSTLCSPTSLPFSPPLPFLLSVSASPSP